MKALLLAILFCVPAYAMAPQDPPAEVVAQVERNAEQIDRLAARAADQDFILKLLAIIMPTLGVVVVALLQLKNNRQLTQVAKAVDGLQDKLVAETRTTGRMEGAQMEAEKQADPDANGHLTIAEATVKVEAKV